MRLACCLYASFGWLGYLSMTGAPRAFIAFFVFLLSLWISVILYLLYNPSDNVCKRSTLNECVLYVFSNHQVLHALVTGGELCSEPVRAYPGNDFSAQNLCFLAFWSLVVMVTLQEPGSCDIHISKQTLYQKRPLQSKIRCLCTKNKHWREKVLVYKMLQFNTSLSVHCVLFTALPPV